MVALFLLSADESTGTWGRIRKTASRRTEGRGIVLLTFIIIMVALLEPP